MTRKEKAIIVSMIANGCEFRKEMAIINNKEYEIDELNRIVILADEALEKQMPKRPIEDGYYDEPAVCPNCGGDVINQCDNDYQFQYCHYCGQKLDWSAHPTEKGGAE